MVALAPDTCTLFEATFISGSKLARADILVKRGQVIELIEIKSCGFDRAKNDERVRSGQSNLFHAPRAADGLQTKWRPYLEDAAFQTAILQDVFPDLEIVPYLLMPDTSRPCPVDGLHHQFSLRTSSGGAGVPSAEYTGDRRELHRGLFLTRVEVGQEVARLLPTIRQRADAYAADLMPSLRRAAPTLSVDCRHCEYRLTEGDRRGFHDCWGALADASPHILDLYHISDLGGRGGPLANELIAAGKASVLDIPERAVRKSDGSRGEVAHRQLRQLTGLRENREWLDEELRATLAALPYPHFFVDFETCAPAVPRYRGLRPFETIAFQWCCQTVRRAGRAAELQ